MKKLIVTTAAAIAIATSGYVAHEHQVEQLRYEYNVQLNHVEKENVGLQKDVKGISNQYFEMKKSNAVLQTDISQKTQQIQQQAQQIKSQSDEISQLKNQISQYPRQLKTNVTSNNWTTFSASAYTTHTNGDPNTSGAWGNKTATGTVPVEGRTIAVDRNLIPLGTKLQVKFPTQYSYLDGTYIAEDTGSAINGHKVDLYLNSLSKCLNFGVQDIQVSIIN